MFKQSCGHTLPCEQDCVVQPASHRLSGQDPLMRLHVSIAQWHVLVQEAPNVPLIQPTEQENSTWQTKLRSTLNELEFVKMLWA